MNAIFTRRSIRKFKDSTIEQDKIEKMLRAAMQAPSAANGQPWEFIVVQNKEMLKKLSQLKPTAKCLENVGVAIIVLGNKDKMVIAEMWQQDLGAATQNILLQAVELGLGSVWLGTAGKEDKMEFVSRMFNLSENLLPYGVLAIGYPEDENANCFVDRYDESKIKYL